MPEAIIFVDVELEELRIRVVANPDDALFLEASRSLGESLAPFGG